MTTPTSGKGGKLEINSTGSTYVAFGKYTKLKGPELSANVITYKTLDTDAAQKLTGDIDYGMVSGTVVYDVTDYTAMAAYIGVEKTYHMTYAPGTTGALLQTFSGRLNKLSAPEMVNDQLATSDFEVEVNGAITNSTVA